MTDSAELLRSREILESLTRARRRLQELESATREPIAIVGIGCRFPGGATSPAAFSRLLFDGRCTRSIVPRDRWDAEALYHPDPNHPGTSVARHGCFVDGIDRFDHEFFGIAGREARYMDPQQRLLLEVTWEALEHAGIAPGTLSASDAGVFVGISTNEYAQINGATGPREGIDRYSGTGAAFCVGAGRISHVLGLRGPSLAVDTACSSSLVAVHLACQALRNRECGVALAGGVNALLHPNGFVYFSRMRALSPRGICSTFDASADGYVRGEGCGIVVLKRLSDAISAHDRILAVIRGSAINHDGRSSGLTVPNGSAQAAVIRAALRAARIEPAEVGYLEAHGTGTALGDPIELRAVTEVLGKGRAGRPPLWVGSVKASIGHLEAAAGVAGLIKTVLLLQAGRVAPQTNFETPSPHIPWGEIPVRVPRAAEAWGEAARIAGVSGFGFSGTNAHVVLAEAPPSARPPARRARTPVVLCLSARTEEALAGLGRAYAEHLAANPNLDPRSLSYTAAVGREHFRERRAIVATDLPELRERLVSLPRSSSAAADAKIAFYLGDRGLEPAAVRALYDSWDVFREAFDACGASAASLAGIALSPDDRRPPAALAGMYALGRLFAAWGLEPLVAVGEGRGAPAAALIAGRLSLEEALRALLFPSEPIAKVRSPRIAHVDMPGPEEVPSRGAGRGAVVMEELQRLGVAVVLELGAEAVPGSWLKETWRAAGHPWIGVPVSGEGVDAQFRWSFLAELYESGVDLRWEGVFAGEAVEKLHLPTYPFERSRLWIEAPTLLPKAPATEGRPAAYSDNDVEDVPVAARDLVVEARWIEAPSSGPSGQGLASSGPWALLDSEDRSVLRALEAQLTAARVSSVHVNRLGLSTFGEGSWAGLVVGPGLAGDVAAISEIVRAMATRPDPSPIWLLTRGAQTVGRESASAARAGLEAAASWGLGRVIALEHPERWGGCIDLPAAPADPEAEARFVAGELLGGDGEDQVAFREGRRFVLRLRRPADDASERRLHLREDSTYLVTGGLGELGLKTAAWLAARGARHIVLTGRSRPPAHDSFDALLRDRALRRRLEALGALEERGVSVRVEHVDVTDAAAMAEILRSVDAGGRPLRGIMHLAGLRELLPVTALTPASYEPIYAAKARGADVLDRLTKTTPLDLFVVFSSIAGVWGSPGLGAYAAANRTIDELAARRADAGLPALSVAWGPWAGGGMVTDAEAEQLEAVGVRPLAPARAFEALEALLTTGRTNAVVADVDWTHFRRGYEARPRRRLLVDLGDGTAEPWHGSAVAAVAAIAPEARASYIRQALIDRIARVLGVPVGSIVRDRPLVMLGLDSLMALDLAAAVEKDLGLKIPVQALLVGADLDGLVALLCGALHSPPDPVADAGATPPPAKRLAKAARSRRLRAVLGSPEFMPMSIDQRGIWYLQSVAPDSAAHNLTFSAWLERDVDELVLKQAAQRLVDRHEVLRSTFLQLATELVRRIEPSASVDWAEAVAQPAEADDPHRCVARHADAPFNLAAASPLRLRIVSFTDGRRLFIATAHHIAVDFRSLGILLGDLASLYHTEIDGSAPALPALPVVSTDFVQREQALLASPDGERLRAFWKKRLSGPLPVLVLPTDRPRPASLTWAGAVVERDLSDSLAHVVCTLATETAVTPFTVLFAAFNVLLQKYSGQDDIIVGAPMTIAEEPEVQTVVGNFVNAVALRSDLSGDPSFRTVLERTRTVVSEAIAHRRLPFSLLVEELDAPRDPSRTPLFNVAFVWLKDLHVAASSAPATPDSSLRLVPLFAGQRGAVYDLVLTVFERPGGLSVRVTFNTALYDLSTADRLLDHYVELLGASARAPETPIASLSLLPPGERTTLLEVWNGTQRDHSAELRRDGVALHEPFRHRALEHRDRIAVTFGDQRITYGELAARASLVARRLAAVGVGPGSVVGVCMHRSFELMVALYGILEAGAAYLPLEPDVPLERRGLMVADADVRVVLAQPDFSDGWPISVSHLFTLTDGGVISGSGPEAQPKPAGAEDVAYVIFTSGSTGRPKGVMVTHRAIRNRLIWMQDAYRLTPDDRVLQKTPIGFDVSVWELFWPLAVGARLVLALPDEHRLPGELAARIDREGITTMHFVPSMLRAFLDELKPGSGRGLKRVICSGEALAADLRDRFFDALSAELHNLYGPTEAAVDVTAWQCHRSDRSAVVPIGRPIANTRIYILDRQQRLCPIGVPGEIAIAGVQVAAGYVGRPDLTGERFREDPYARSAGERMYLTGDLGRFRADGVIEYLGRFDHQVKVRGVRIELGEIESSLQQHPDVSQSCVVAATGPDADTQLVAYVSAASGRNPSASDLRAFLSKRLPAPMIPARFVWLEQLPLTASGKIDRKSLPAWQEPPSASELHNQPLTATERVVIDVCKRLLSNETLGPDDDFFAAGGHSLLVASLVANLRDRFGITVTPRSIFEAPVIRAIAGRIDETLRSPAPDREPQIEAVPRVDEPPLSSAQRRLWLLQQFDPQSPAYNTAAVLRLHGPLDAKHLKESLAAMMERHEVLRTSFPTRRGRPVPEVAPKAELPLEFADLSSLPAPEREREVESRLRQQVCRPFHLGQGPLVRFLLARHSAEEHLLSVTLHHIICDGWSVGLMIRELAAAYRGLEEGRGPELAPPLLQYIDYAHWEQKRLTPSALAPHLAYWKSHLDGAPAAVRWPADGGPVGGAAGAASVVRAQLPSLLVGELEARCREAQSTPFVLLLAAWARTLRQWTGQEDLVVGTVAANRDAPALQEMLGCFMNFLPLRLRPAAHLAPAALLEQVKSVVVQGLSHQECPFDLIVDAVKPRRRSTMPLYNVALLWQGFEGWAEHDRLSLGPALRASLEPLSTGRPLLDLRLVAEPVADGIALMCEFRDDVFSVTAVERLLGEFCRSVKELVTAGQASLSTLEATVSRIVAETTGRGPPSLHEDLFAAGLGLEEASRVAAELARALARPIALEDLLAAPSIAALAARINQPAADQERPDDDLLALVETMSEAEAEALLRGAASTPREEGQGHG